MAVAAKVVQQHQGGIMAEIQQTFPWLVSQYLKIHKDGVAQC